MGKNNKQRRASKAKARKQRRGADHREWAAGHDPGFAGRPPSERDRVEGLIGLDQMARSVGSDRDRVEAGRGLAACSPATVARELERELARILPLLWDGGWQPGEVLRQVRRATSVSGERLVGFAVGVDHRRRDGSTLHPRWRAHVDGLGLPAVTDIDSWLRSRELTESLTTTRDWPEVIDLALEVAFALTGLRRLAEIIPPPGAGRANESVIDLTAQEADPILAKVRGLLAQAESTTFDAEAEAFTAKAQELMARHALDSAMVWARADRGETPLTTRVPLDDPYMDAKSLLLTVVADESQCRAIIDNDYALASVVGFESDLVWCETLYTSLLVQAQHELSRAGDGDRAGGRRRSRSFRSSFLVAYAHRIGERLAEVNAHVHQAAAAGGDDVGGAGGIEPGRADDDGQQALFGDGSGSVSLVPVLAQRRSIIDETIEASFGTLSSGMVRGGSDWLGWNAGRQAADRAHLTRGSLATSATS